MRALRTRYVGPDGTEDFFRSRIEARWAVFLDTLGLQWRYEWQGYDLGHGVYYLPDFWLPEAEFWVEVKGVFPTPGEQEKAALLCQQGKRPVLISWTDFRQDGGDTLYFYTDANGLFRSSQHFTFNEACGFLFAELDIVAACSAARQAKFDGKKRHEQVSTQFISASQYLY
jgi:hypothetical protein